MNVSTRIKEHIYYLNSLEVAQVKQFHYTAISDLGFYKSVVWCDQYEYKMLVLLVLFKDFVTKFKTTPSRKILFFFGFVLLTQTL